ncbi:MAG: HAD-IIA family hydrolase [Chloroflexi bacterium]|uniref:HAD-IIA family hydrolase n=1 Tax=Candidatus Chlorohelix allophototropha TaxID=3003348 RepID=A0A8T7M7K0_9CHLR|nr:HAD-IIA family hydrolase [Chloroflexota bacterium]WJW68030.1 HAD-IIA family hydrolase [Chloroflexota bacterium L227-S17]
MDTTHQNQNTLARFRFALMDMDGVLYRGNQSLPGLVEFFDFLEHAGIGYRLLTNNASMTSDDYHHKLLKMGVDVPPEKIITSPLATILHLRKIAPEGAGIYVIGMAALRRTLFGENEQNGLFYFDDKTPRFVVQGADFNLVYESLRKATLLIRAGATYIATNADPVFPSEEGLIPGAGSVAALLQTASGQRPFIIGKPEPIMYELALEQLGAQKHETVMIGDNLVTDIEGALRLDIPTIITLSGVTSPVEYAASLLKADLSFNGLPELTAAWQSVL